MMPPTDLHAWHLPALAADDVLRMEVQRHGDVRVHIPVLRPGVMTRLATRLQAARREHLVTRPVAEIVAIIDAATEHLTTGELRSIALEALPAVCRMSPAMAARVLDGMAREWRSDALHALLAAEIGDAALLDRFMPRGAVQVRAFGPPLITHIFSGNVPGVAVTSLVRALLVKSASIGKSAAGEPVLAPLFARALATVDRGVADCVAVTYWAGGASEIEAEALAAADITIVYGGEQAVAALRARAPGGRHIIEHGPKLSFGVVGREALRGEQAARATAREVAAATADFDQHGCVSPHVIFVERGHIEPNAFAALIASALSELNETLPRGELAPADAAKVREVATRTEFRGIADPRTTLHEAEGALVVYDELPTIEASCLNRTLFVKPIDAGADVIDRVAPYRDVLQSVALAGFSSAQAEELAAQLAAIGVTRITDFPRLAWPAATWHHDGRGPLLELLRFVDLEVGTASGRGPA